VTLIDHLGGFDQFGNNLILEKINQIASIARQRISVTYHNILDSAVLSKYSNIDFVFDAHLQHTLNFSKMTTYNVHPSLKYVNFVCSFNGSSHVSRKLLVAILKKFGCFDPDFCSKNFCYTSDVVDGHVSDYVVGDQSQFYNKFFLNDETFNQSLATFGHVRFDHGSNIHNLEHKLTKSFLHLVSETMATSYQPFVTEKFLYSIVTRGLFLTYAQPGWHTHLEKYYGFKRYTKLFDYRFDSIQNPIERLVELMTMISKFRLMSPDEWHNLYLLESNTIEYNYDHYFSGNYLKKLKNYE
jgi:hypothetical protein